MSGRTITVTLPEALYERVKETAEASARSVEEVFAQSIALSLPGLEQDLPSALRSELAALPLLSDAELEHIAHGTLEEEQQARLEALAELQKQRPLTAAEESMLAHLMDEAHRVMLCKAEAYRLLARRGHAIFSPSGASPD
jgi:predicted transcriptional regulator